MTSLRTTSVFILLMAVGCCVSLAGDEIVVQPNPYPRALRNPLKGFTSTLR